VEQCRTRTVSAINGDFSLKNANFFYPYVGFRLTLTVTISSRHLDSKTRMMSLLHSDKMLMFRHNITTWQTDGQKSQIDIACKCADAW